MSEFLEEILKIEKTADKILNDATKECELIKQRVSEDKKKIVEKIEQFANEKYEIAKNEEETKFLEKCKEIELEKERKLNMLKDLYEEKQKEWLEKIVFSVLNFEDLN